MFLFALIFFCKKKHAALLKAKRKKEYFELNGHHNLGKTGINAPQYGINGKSVYCYSSDGQFMHFLSINQAVRFNIDSNPIIIRGVT